MARNSRRSRPRGDRACVAGAAASEAGMGEPVMAVLSSSAPSSALLRSSRSEPAERDVSASGPVRERAQDAERAGLLAESRRRCDNDTLPTAGLEREHDPAAG